MHDKVFHGASHQLLIVQRKFDLHDVPQLGFGLWIRAPEEEAQAAELMLEFLVPRHQQEAERVIDGLRHSRRRGERWPAFVPLAPPWDIEYNVIIQAGLVRDIRTVDYCEDRKRVLDIIYCGLTCILRLVEIPLPPGLRERGLA